MATFLDSSFKPFEFIPQTTVDDIRFNFKRNLMKDVDDWIVTEMNTVAAKVTAVCTQVELIELVQWGLRAGLMSMSIRVFLRG